MKLVPSKPTELILSLINFSPVASAIWRIGIFIWLVISGATMCIVFVQIIKKSAPATSTDFAAFLRIAAVASQSPACCNCSIFSKSKLFKIISAE